jgi:hypothetical protein
MLLLFPDKFIGIGGHRKEKGGKNGPTETTGVYWLVAGKAKWKAWLNLFIA